MLTKEEWIVILGGIGVMFFLFWVMFHFIIGDVVS